MLLLWFRAEIPAAEAEAYLEVLTSAMADAQITREEAVELGTLAGEAGMTKVTVAASTNDSWRPCAKLRSPTRS